eukprot:691416-Prymnesium_polylepis.2
MDTASRRDRISEAADLRNRGRAPLSDLALLWDLELPMTAQLQQATACPTHAPILIDRLTICGGSAQHLLLHICAHEIFPWRPGEELQCTLNPSRGGRLAASDTNRCAVARCLGA